MSGQHTQGRLKVSGVRLYLEGKAGRLIATMGVSDTEKEDADRVAACWNACEGISTEALLKFGHACSGWKSASYATNDAIAQRDELLAQLEALTDMAADAWGEDRPAVKVARAAIAKAKATGGAA